MNDVQNALAKLIKEGVTVYKDSSHGIPGSHLLTFPNREQYELGDAGIEALAIHEKPAIQGIRKTKEPVEG